jgi:hypothetical protein
MDEETCNQLTYVKPSELRDVLSGKIENPEMSLQALLLVCLPLLEHLEKKSLAGLVLNVLQFLFFSCLLFY